MNLHRRYLGALTAVLLSAAPAVAHDDGHVEIPVAPYEEVIAPDQALVIAEPLPYPSGVLIHDPERITVFLRTFEFELRPSSLELWIDGVEYTEQLRFWVDRAWIDVGPGFWDDGSHTVMATALDVTGRRVTENAVFDKLTVPTASSPVPVAPHEITNLIEDYQGFSNGQKWHRGLDFRTDAGTEVQAARGGTVVKIEHYWPNLGAAYWSIGIEDAFGFVWQYHHLDPATFTVGENDVVNEGDVLGEIFPWPALWNGSLYHHLHLNVARWLGQGPIPGPYVDGWEYHNPLKFLDTPADADTVTGLLTEVLFGANEGDSAYTKDSDPGAPIVMGDVDIYAQTVDLRTVVPAIGGHPFNLGWYKVSYSVVPLGGDCWVGWIPKTDLARFDRIPYGTAIATHDSTLLQVFKPFVKNLNSDNYESQFDYDARKFLYTVTNTRWGVINGPIGYWDTDWVPANGPAFPDGDYEVVVYFKDFEGNELTHAMEVEVSNGIPLIGLCPTDILGLGGEGGGDDTVWLTFDDNTTVPVPIGSLPLSFSATSEGSAWDFVGSWPGWSFPAPRGAVYDVQLRAGEKIEVEYVPFLGDVILEIPAEVVCRPTGGGSVVTADVDLRLSTRLARDDWSGAALIGSPHAFGKLTFSLVMSDEFTIGGQGAKLHTDSDGADVSWSVAAGGVEVDPPVQPSASLQVFPNPFRGRASIRYESAAPVSGSVTVEVLNIEGALVRTVSLGSLESGSTVFTWDGMDDAGREVPAGVYFVQTSGAQVLAPRKIVKLE
jgi:hypothetical protein